MKIGKAKEMFCDPELDCIYNSQKAGNVFSESIYQTIWVSYSISIGSSVEYYTSLVCSGDHERRNS